MRMHIPIYFRYIITRFIRTALLIFLTFFTTILLVELTVHFPFQSIKTMMLHITAVFFKRLDLLMPLSYLFTTIQLIGTMHRHNEINALNTSGISMKDIISPLYLVAFITAGVLTLNHQFIVPRTNPWLLDEIRSQKNAKHNTEYEVRFLDDGSRIIFSKGKTQLEDLYWIRSHKEIWHCTEVSFEDQLPVGFYVDKLHKNEKHEFVKASSFHRYTLPESFLSAKPLVEQKNELSISTLFKLLTKHNLAITADKGFIYSLFCYKLITPFFPILVLTGIIPFVLPYKRRIKQMNLYTIGTVMFLVFHTVIKSCIILAEHYVASPLLTIILIPLLIQAVLSYNLWKTLSPPPILETKPISKEVSSQPA